MTTLKFKMSKEEMLQFNDHCNDAANACPQYSNDMLLEDRDILQGKISAKQLVKHWKKCNVLFEYGYEEELSLDASEIFSRYEEYKEAKRLEKSNA